MVFGVGGWNGAISGSLGGGTVTRKTLHQLGFLVCAGCHSNHFEKNERTTDTTSIPGCAAQIRTPLYSKPETGVHA